MAVAAGIIANGVTEILKKLSSIVANEITLVWDFKDELKNLQSTLNMILDVMEDAEKKQLSQAAVRRWMEELKAIAYDAEDILDDYSYEVILCKHQKDEEYNKSRIRNKVRNIFSSSSKPSFVASWKLARKVKKINEEFNKIAKRKNDLGLQTIEVGSSSSSSSHELMMKNRLTDSLVVTDWKFVGRENDKSTIIKMLLEEENSSNNQGGSGKHVSVVAIMGMGGLGKTTMAQQVYNDEVVKEHFELKIWICVSDPFDIEKLWKNIAKKIGITDMADLACSLQNALKKKKFILVLDDVWNENPTYWNNFKKPFMVGAEGSRILVTTRNEKVALIMVDKFLPYPLGILNENDCWSLFKEITFGSAAGAVETPKLVEIGKVMVNRCKGLPLAVIFLGSLMRSKKKEEEWEIIRDTKLWHESRDGKNSEILPSLKLSYDYLPSYLKLCFSYCCLFPKDWIIKRKKLIQLWMAEGFLIETPRENTMSMEEIGNEYFHSLLSSFFFQDVQKNKDGDIAKCKMHDLVHDLARSVVGNHECLIVENALDIDYISEVTRRLNLLVNLNDGEMLRKLLEALKKAKNLRTIFVNQIIRIDIGNAFKENKRLRVLDFGGSYVIAAAVSTSSIGGELKHLRYLEVHGNNFPKGIISRLRFIQTLNRFTKRLNFSEEKNMNACGIEEVEGLNLLRVFRIDFLENVTSGAAACRANLKKKKNLRSLNLSWRFDDDVINNNYETVMEGLQPHPNLRSLKIYRFQGSKLPRWIEDSSCLPNLVELKLFRLERCEQLAGFGALPSLRTLTLDNMEKLECIGNEFYYSAAATGVGGSSSSLSSAGGGSTTTASFPSLKKLTLEDMQSLKEWVVPVPTHASTTGATSHYCFPLLEEIEIKYCTVLTTITPTTTIIFPSLKVLSLQHMDGRAVHTLVSNNLKSLTSLTLLGIPNHITLPRQGLLENNNTLLSLTIEWCIEFEGFFPPNNDEDDDEDQGKQLQEVSQVVSSSSGSSSSSSLQSVKYQEGGGQQLQEVSQVVSSSSCSSSLQSLTFYRCPVLRFYPNIRSLTSLRALDIIDCKQSKSLQDELTCLSSSSFSSLEHLEYVQILNNKTATEEEDFSLKWRKSSTFKE